MTHTTTSLRQSRRVRAVAISVGILLGMAAGAFSSQAQAKAVPARKNAATLPAADEAQLAAAERVLVGRYGCEFGKQLSLDRNDSNRGYFNLKMAQRLWVMKPVLSSTGAIRMEDVKGQLLLLQILTKSMLMDVKAGHRIVDGCVHDVQRAAEESLRTNPMASNLN